MSFINIHYDNDIMLPLGSVLQNPFWKTRVVLKIFWDHSQKFKATSSSHPTSVHPVSQFQIAEFWKTSCIYLTY